MDAGSGIFGQRLYVSWRDELRVHEWRQCFRRRRRLPAPDDELRLRCCAGRGREAHEEVLSLPRCDSAADGHHATAFARTLPMAGMAEVELVESVPLWSNLPAPATAEHPRSMETFGQGYGYILYRTQLTGPVAGQLEIEELRDYAAVYLNQKLVGTLDRRLKQKQLALTAPAGPATLDILVENTGRVNFGPLLQEGQAGITRSVSLGGRELSGWRVYSLPMTGPDGLKGWQKKAIPGPAFHRGTFTHCIRYGYVSRREQSGQGVCVGQRSQSWTHLEDRPATVAVSARGLAAERCE